MLGRTFAAPLAAIAALLTACALAGCNDQTATGTTGPSDTAAGEPTAQTAGLPFTYSAAGESSSPSFAIGTSGTYTVAYHVSTNDTPSCTASIDLVSTEGASEPVLPRTDVTTAKPLDATATPQLGQGTWRFQAAGGCSWKVTVSAGA